MSALGQKQTFAVQKGMSALPPIADFDDLSLELIAGAKFHAMLSKVKLIFLARSRGASKSVGPLCSAGVLAL
jgi:hypothetical protein